MKGKPDSTVKTIVLVHGGFVDGSGWEEVYKILKRDGYNLSIVQNPTISLADDVSVTKRVLATHSGPVILVGHSYGGAVITEAGNDPKVAGLVYTTAFALDNGESVSALIKDPPPGAPVPPILPPQDGFLFLDKAKFPASFAADVEAEKAAFMADSQVPWGVNALSGTRNLVIGKRMSAICSQLLCTECFSGLEDNNGLDDFAPRRLPFREFHSASPARRRARYSRESRPRNFR